MRTSRNQGGIDDVLPHTARAERHEAREDPGVDLQRWKRILQELPVVRVEKVIAVREALRHARYDTEAILAETISRVGNDVGILSRRELTDEYGSG
jgi:hypothetical protein